MNVIHNSSKNEAAKAEIAKLMQAMLDEKAKNNNIQPMSVMELEKLLEEQTADTVEFESKKNSEVNPTENKTSQTKKAFLIGGALAAVGVAAGFIFKNGKVAAKLKSGLGKLGKIVKKEAKTAKKTNLGELADIAKNEKGSIGLKELNNIGGKSKEIKQAAKNIPLEITC